MAIGVGCPFCMIDPGRVVVRGRHAFAIRAEDGPEGSAMVLPVAHRGSPFEFTPAEWRETITILAATRDLLSAEEAISAARKAIANRYDSGFVPDKPRRYTVDKTVPKKAMLVARQR